eukprot:1234221-Pyramimonas_sp.AAC.1
MSLIFGSFAWDQRECSFRSSRVTTLGSRLRKFCKLIARRTLTCLEVVVVQQGYPQVAVEMDILLAVGHV